MDITLGVRAT